MRALAARRDIRLLALAVVLGIAARLLYVLSVRHHALVGDEAEYDIEGVFFTHGRFLFSTAPYGIAHSSIWKTPGYSAWVGGLYTVLGHHQGRVEIVQAVVCGPATIVLTWLLGRRLVGPRAGLAAAFIVAVYPFAFQYEGLLYSEALATPLSVLLLLCFLRVSRLSRLWDIRRPARALDEVHFEGRSRLATKIGLGMYWIMLPFALLGLWAFRRWRAVVVPVLLTALAASVVFTTDSGTRYRAPLEPLVVVLACGGAAALRTGWRSTRG